MHRTDQTTESPGAAAQVHGKSPPGAPVPDDGVVVGPCDDAAAGGADAQVLVPATVPGAVLVTPTPTFAQTLR